MVNTGATLALVLMLREVTERHTFKEGEEKLPIKKLVLHWIIAFAVSIAFVFILSPCGFMWCAVFSLGILYAHFQADGRSPSAIEEPQQPVRSPRSRRRMSRRSLLTRSFKLDPVTRKNLFYGN
jgi:hypothetical protein